VKLGELLTAEVIPLDEKDNLPWVHPRRAYHYIRRPKTAVGYGTCLKCGARDQELGDGLCLKCYDRVSVSMQLYYRHKSQGMCIDCRHPTLPPFVRCGPCRERTIVNSLAFRARELEKCINRERANLVK
jgi:hypothetical protein